MISTANGRPAIFWDRDGTLIEDRGFLSCPEQVVFFAQTIPALQSLAPYFEFFIVSNQSGVAKGLITIEQVHQVNGHVLAVLAAAGIGIRHVYVCPHQRSDGCTCIKPNPYFLEDAVKSYGIVLDSSFVVGDHPHDAEFGLGVGAQGIYLLTGHGMRHRAEVPDAAVVLADISEAAAFILRYCSNQEGAAARSIPENGASPRSIAE